MPEAYKGLPWARNGVDPDNDFKTLYVVPADKKEQIRKLKALLKDADELYLATDEDREGEAISWHLLEVLSPRVPVKRMVFHEITQPAIERAVREWRELDMPLVDAQETRRILDRLYGYEVSPVLWRKVGPNLSAGRVQSVADPHRRRARAPADGVPVGGLVGPRGPLRASAPCRRPRSAGTSSPSTAPGWPPAGTSSPTGRSPPTAAVVRLDEAGARSLATGLAGADLAVRSVEEKPYTAAPAGAVHHLDAAAGGRPQAALRRPRRTMQVAQRLYENGYITYMRTDSTTLSETALAAARDQARQLYGPEYVPAQPRIYTRKVKNAQEAHEAIRPAGETFRMPEQVAAELGPDELRLYDLIWKRTVASQMADARGQTVQVRFGGSVVGRARTRSSPPAARSSHSRGSCGPTSRAPTIPMPSSRTRSGRCPRSRSATCSSRSSSSRSRTRRHRRPATPRPP